MRSILQKANTPHKASTCYPQVQVSRPLRVRPLHLIMNLRECAPISAYEPDGQDAFLACAPLAFVPSPRPGSAPTCARNRSIFDPTDPSPSQVLLQHFLQKDYPMLHLRESGNAVDFFVPLETECGLDDSVDSHHVDSHPTNLRKRARRGDGQLKRGVSLSLHAHERRMERGILPLNMHQGIDDDLQRRAMDSFSSCLLDEETNPLHFTGRTCEFKIFNKTGHAHRDVIEFSTRSDNRTHAFIYRHKQEELKLSNRNAFVGTIPHDMASVPVLCELADHTQYNETYRMLFSLDIVYQEMALGRTTTSVWT